MNKYEIASDIRLLKKLLDLSDEKLANELGITRLTINNWLNEKKQISNDNLDTLYNYIFDKNIALNEIKSQIYIEECNNKNGQIIFHGSKQGIVGKISYNKSKEYNDFGNGFYCGESYEQAAMFVSPYNDSSVYLIYFEKNKLKELEFHVDQEWMIAIAYYRGALNEYKNTKYIQKIINKIEKADYIIAPIADNKMFDIIDTFIKGEITDEQCKHSLAATNLGKQYVLKSEKCLGNIKIAERLYLCENEKKYLLSENINRQQISQDKVKTARIKYRGKGKYIDEILI